MKNSKLKLIFSLGLFLSLGFIFTNSANAICDVPPGQLVPQRVLIPLSVSITGTSVNSSTVTVVVAGNAAYWLGGCADSIEVLNNSVVLTIMLDGASVGSASVTADSNANYRHTFVLSGVRAGSHAVQVTASSGSASDSSRAAFSIPYSSSPPGGSGLWAQLLADPLVVTQGYSTYLSWSSGGSTSTITCIGTNFSTGGAPSGATSVVVQTGTTYTVTCTSASSTASASISVSTVPWPSASASISPSKLVRGGGYFNINWGGGSNCFATLVAGIALNVSGNNSFQLWTPDYLNPGSVSLYVNCKNALGVGASARASADVGYAYLHWYGYENNTRLPSDVEGQITFTAVRDYSNGDHTEWPNSRLNDGDDRVWAFNANHTATYYVKENSVSTGEAYDYEYIGNSGPVTWSDPTAVGVEKTIGLNFYRPTVTAQAFSTPPSVLRGNPVTLSWQASENATDCFKLAGAGFDVSGISGSDVTSPLDDSTTFSLLCYRDSNRNGKYDFVDSNRNGKWDVGERAEAHRQVNIPVPIFYHNLNIDAAVYRGGCGVGQAEPMGADASTVKVTLNQKAGLARKTEVGVGSYAVWGEMPKSYNVVSASAPGFLYCGSSASASESSDSKISLSHQKKALAASGSATFDSITNSQTRTLTVYFAPREINPPPPPTGLSASGECQQTHPQPAPQVYLSWNPSSGARDYAIYRDGNLVGATAQTYYIDRSVLFAKNYSYQVTARNWAGESSPAGPVSVTTPDQNSCSVPPPTSPTYNIIPAEQTIEVGSTTQFIGLYDADGPSGDRFGDFDVSDRASWGIADSSIAQSLGGGRYKGLSAGGDFRDVSSTYGNITAYASLYVVPSGPYFDVSLSPAEQTVQKPASTTYTVTVTPKNGFTGQVSLVAQNLPVGVTASTPSPVNITDSNPRSTTLTLSVSDSASLGRFTFTVSGTSSALPEFSDTAQADIVIVPSGPYFTLSLTPLERSVQKPGSTTYTVTVTPKNGFTGQVSLVAQNLPGGVSYSLVPSSVNITDNNSKESTLNVTVPGNAPTGSFNFTVVGSSTDFSYSLNGRLVIGVRPGVAADIFADPSIINAGEQTTLHWSSVNAVRCEIDQGIGAVCNSLSSCEKGGIKIVAPSVTTNYTLTCRGSNGNEVTDSAAVTVRSDVHAECRGEACILVSGPGENQCLSNENCGGLPTHTICKDNACQVVSEPGINECATDNDCASGGHSECFGDACVFISGPGYSQCASNTDCQVPPTGCSLKASPSYLLFSGMPVKLTWSCRNPQNITSCSIDQGIGYVSPQGGSRIVRPRTTTTYTLTCGNNPPASATVNVGLKPIIREILPR